MALLASLTLPACTVLGIRSGTEEPHFVTLATLGDVQIRRYDARLAAETTVEGTERHARYAGFRRLADYIFGANRAQAKIAMTAPVGQQREGTAIAMTAPVAQEAAGDGRWTIRFFMPARYTAATLPVPTDPAVRIVTVPAQTYAVLRFSGLPTPQSVAGEQARLLRTIGGSAWQATGAPLAWFYDPPWTIPFLRRNEVAVEVTQK